MKCTLFSNNSVIFLKLSLFKINTPENPKVMDLLLLKTLNPLEELVLIQIQLFVEEELIVTSPPSAALVRPRSRRLPEEEIKLEIYKVHLLRLRGLTVDYGRRFRRRSLFFHIIDTDHMPQITLFLTIKLFIIHKFNSHKCTSNHHLHRHLLLLHIIMAMAILLLLLLHSFQEQHFQYMAIPHNHHHTFLTTRITPTCNNKQAYSILQCLRSLLQVLPVNYNYIFIPYSSKVKIAKNSPQNTVLKDEHSPTSTSLRV
uniref:Uncharacterized protein n=1 Tax=Cucumis melo TaxID=3656 RepID=A0A9I9D052_CUCME